MEPGFTDYLDDLIIAIADAQRGQEISPADVRSLHLLKFHRNPETWAVVAGEEMEKRGWGKRYATWGEAYFHINGAGLARAQEVRRTRQPKTLWDRVKSVPRSDWIAIAALVISAVALFKPG